MAKAENTVIFDGIKYNPGDELPDLGSWVCTDARGMVRDYEGLSKDVSKLPHYVQSGSSALCLDTSELYEYHKRARSNCSRKCLLCKTLLLYIHKPFNRGNMANC